MKLVEIKKYGGPEVLYIGNRPIPKIRVNEIFRDIFDDDSLVIRDETTASDIPDWDSLMQIELVAAHESYFGLRFGMKEVLNMKNVGEMIDVILKRATK